MDDLLDYQNDDGFGRSFATAINESFSREMLFNIHNISEVTYLELTEIVLAEKAAIHFYCSGARLPDDYLDRILHESL